MTSLVIVRSSLKIQNVKKGICYPNCSASNVWTMPSMDEFIQSVDTIKLQRHEKTEGLKESLTVTAFLSLSQLQINSSTLHQHADPCLIDIFLALSVCQSSGCIK